MVVYLARRSAKRSVRCWDRCSEMRWELAEGASVVGVVLEAGAMAAAEKTRVAAVMVADAAAGRPGFFEAPVEMLSAGGGKVLVGAVVA